MAMFWKAVALGLLVALGPALQGRGAEAQGNGRDKHLVSQKQVSGDATMFLGQEREKWRPLIHTTVNLTDISSIKSSFQLRTFDPEGVIFYGDTKGGRDWFVLSLKDGIPLMQIYRSGMYVSVAGGAKLSDGEWHTLEVSNHGDFVILEMDGSNKLVVGMHPAEPEEALSGELRLAVGGVLISTDHMIVPVEPRFDACVRQGSWLNLSTPWETDAEELWSCYQHLRPGSYFSGAGFAIFNTSGFDIDTHAGIKVELLGDFSKMDGTILSIKAAGQEPTFTLTSNNNTEEVTFTFGEKQYSMKAPLRKLEIIFQSDLIQLRTDKSDITDLSPIQVGHSGYLEKWRNGRLGLGGLLGESEDEVGSHFLAGCLEKIQVQGKDLDLDLAVKHKSITSHSCPA
ncbi:sex hormone-binding globulin isoform X1 [Takifugu rubripes]|uniref:sex hormone-binding globulin isoform X1 n=1 Tax=Takifugu rubripes TaxID=31033 RepID=UPI0005D1798A|nr:sex hormone-binding globulin isoform X1 [Takifugu rubripes]|eukprot:XP_011604973.1 PREDICTED: sex hormone-binding globulin isoform X1 [Takifugu rubripes]